MKYIIGIDAGTSNVKSVLFDLEGKEVLAESVENEPIHIGDSDIEQNMTILWDKVNLSIKMLMENGPAKGEDVLGIGLTGQGEGCWLIDKEGKPVQDALLWCDGRASAQIDKMQKEDPDLAQAIHTITGTPALTGTQLMLLKWMKENRKDVLDQAETMFFCKDWVRYKLTGKINGDFSDTSTSLIDVKNGVVAKELLTRLGLEDYIKLIPEQVTSNTIVGTVLPELAEAYGLPKDTPVIAGAIDVFAAAVGIGAVKDKDICVILGTTCANEIFMKRSDCEFGKEGTRFEKHAVGDLFASLMPTMNGTPNIEWALENISKTHDYKEIDRLVEAVPAGSGGVIYHPYISASGERAPFYHPYAKANFFGINSRTTRDVLIRAVYEGISFSIKDCLQGVDRNGTIFIAGGGAKSPMWAQMISDVTGMEVAASIGNEFGAKGAAMMVGIATGAYKDYEDAVDKSCKFERIYRPIPGHTKVYDAMYELYKDIRIANEDLWYKRESILQELK